MAGPLLAIEDLAIGFAAGTEIVPTVRGVSFTLDPGETLGIVGESGSGKSLTARAIMGLAPPGARRTGGRLLFRTRAGEVVDIAALPGRRLQALRAREIAMIFQEPMASLSPVHNIGAQIMTTLRQHLPLSRRAAHERALDWLARVGMPRPADIAANYPHQLSGGMRQRAMIAMALSCEPRLLICDEPTTALDVTTEAQIVDLLDSLRRELAMSMIFISHNVALVSEVADRVMVMYLGEAVESGARADVFGHPAHPYTAGLLRSNPGIAQPGERLSTLEGNVPDAHSRPAGCGFHPRCPHHIAGLCDRTAPGRRIISPAHDAHCHLHG